MRISTITFILGVLLLISGLIIPAFGEIKTVKTDCYDQRGAKIIGLECEYNELSFGNYFILAFFGFIFIVLSWVFIIAENIRYRGIY